MSHIKYTIEFFTDWHCGSGLAAGADVDALVIKDKNNLPYIPGKTIKGLLREAVEDVVTFEECGCDKLVDLFGNSQDKDNAGDKSARKGGCFFKNAELPIGITKKIKAENLSEFLYRTISSTAIDNEGIAKAHSLRRIQTVVPCTLEGEILDIPAGCEDLIKKGMGMIKRLGQNRNRGLGRCKFTTIQRGGDQ